MSKSGRNDPCPCGSGKKYKKCCEVKETRKKIENVQVISGSQKMSSLFQRRVAPITPTAPTEPPAETPPK